MTTRSIGLCTTCARSVGWFTRHYRAFLVDPATLFTLISGILLPTGNLINPREIISEHA